MNKLFVLIGIVTLSVSCTQEWPDEFKTSPFEGMWYEEFYDHDTDEGYTFQCNDDGSGLESLRSGQERTDHEFTWKTKGRIIAIDYSGASTSRPEYKVKGGVLTLKYTESGIVDIVTYKRKP